MRVAMFEKCTVDRRNGDYIRNSLALKATEIADQRTEEELTLA